MSTPHEYPPVGKNTYDASEGMFAGIDRIARREEAIRERLQAAFEAGADPDTEVDTVDVFLDRLAAEAIEALNEVDKS